MRAHLMWSLLVAALLGRTTVVHAAGWVVPMCEEDERGQRKPVEDGPGLLLQTYGSPLVLSALAVVPGAAALALGLVGGALAGGAAHQVVNPYLPPVFASRSSVDGPGALILPVVLGAFFGAALFTPVAVLGAAAVDTLAWVGMAAPRTRRQVAWLLGAQAMVMAGTLPLLGLAAVFGMVAVLSARWTEDRLEQNEQRRWATAILGWGPAVLLLVPAVAVAVPFRGVLYAVMADDPRAPPQCWSKRLQERVSTF